MPQRSPSWHRARAGRVTGSCADKVLMGKSTAGRSGYVHELALERITGECEEMAFVSRDMQHGIDTEPAAREALEVANGILVRTTGFIEHNERPIGASLDGDVDDLEAIVEIKCPGKKTHIRYLAERILPKDYVPQVCHNLLVTGADRALFTSFDPRVPLGLQLFVVEVRASDLPMEAYDKALTGVISDVDALEVYLRSLMPSQPVPLTPYRENQHAISQ